MLTTAAAIVGVYLEKDATVTATDGVRQQAAF